MNDLISRFSSRKFLLAVAGTIVALIYGLQDNILTQGELWAALAPLLSFIGVEGAADVVTRKTNIPPVDEESEGAS